MGGGEVLGVSLGSNNLRRWEWGVDKNLTSWGPGFDLEDSRHQNRSDFLIIRCNGAGEMA